MEWLNPIMALYAAAVAVPLLLLLYFLKLKRQEQIVSSTFLWKKAVRDLQVNAPFQRLRRNILLLLQLLALLMMLVALAWPVLSSIGGPARRYIVLIDRSASMNAIDGDVSAGNPAMQSRLDKAKEQAAVFVESMRGRSVFSLHDDSDTMMLIAFDNHADVLCNFTSDKKRLQTAIESITAGHGRSMIAEAINVAHAFSPFAGEDVNTAPEARPKIVLFSDGMISDLDQILLESDEMTYYCVGESTGNIAVTAMQAKRSYEQPDNVEVFAKVTNYSTEPVTCDLQLSVNNNVRAVRPASIEAARIDGTSGSMTPGDVTVSFTLTEIRDGVIELKQLQADSLSCDDTAWAIVSAPEKLAILLVTKGNIVLETALRACSFAEIAIRSPEEYEAMDHLVMSVEQPYNIIVLDNYKPVNLPKCRYLIFGQPPDGIDVISEKQLENQVILDWNRKHSALRYVNFANLVCASCNELILPRDAEVLAEFNETPAVAVVRRNGSIFLLAGFDILQTNWPFEPGFVMFCYNAMNYLGLEVIQNRNSQLHVGEPIIVEGVQPESVIEITGPGFNSEQIQTGSTGTIRFASTFLTGVYEVKYAEQATGLFAVNLLDSLESNTRPRQTLAMAGRDVKAVQGEVSRANIPVWPYLVILVLAVVCAEWLVYTFKMKL